MVLVIWLCLEYYEKHLFFQSGFAPLALYNWLLRSAFALFFYSSFIIGISTVVWWHKIQIPLYPIVHAIGFIMLIASIVMRRRTMSVKGATKKSISQFYMSVILLISSLALGYGSLFLVFYVLVIGCPLVLLLRNHEYKLLAAIEAFAQSNKKKINDELWQLYIEKKTKKQKKKRK
jgi:cell division protein FtsL